MHEGILFLSRFGERIDDSHLTHLMRRYIAASGVNKAGAMHIFRHSMATLMLEGGADVRIIQQILGHVELSTTEIYTRVSTVAVFPAEPALLFQEPDKALDGFDTAPLVGDADAGIGCEWCLALVARK